MRYYFVTVVALLISFQSMSCELTMRVAEGPPLTYKNEKGDWIGLDIELAQVLAKEIKCTLNFKENLHWKRALNHLKRGDVDLMANLSFTRERAETISFVGPIREEQLVLVMRKGTKFKLSSLDGFLTLDDRQIGIGLGSTYGRQFDDRIASDKAFKKVFTAAPNDAVNLQKLMDKKILGFIGDYDQTVYKIQHDKNYQDLNVNTFTINAAPVYFGFSKESVPMELVLKAKDALDKDHVKAMYQKIIARYGLINESETN